MKKILILFILLMNTLVFIKSDIYQNYVQVYGEGPVGQYMLGFDVKTYTKEDAVGFAQNEISEFLSGMVYGYSFEYKISDKNTNTKGYFELNSIGKLKHTNKNIRLTQFQEKRDALRIQALYKLTDDQKTYLAGFQSSIAETSSGVSQSPRFDDWKKRIDIYKDAIRDSILNAAKKRYKSRPLIIKGKILLSNSPRIILVSGEWKVIVKSHIITTDVIYRDVY